MSKVENTKDCQKCWHLQCSGYKYWCAVVGRQTDGKKPKQLCFYDDTYEPNGNGTFNVTSTRTLDGETKIFKTRSAEIEWKQIHI